MVAMSGSGWRLAPALRLLIEQIDAAYPDRPKVSDGSIGDTAHADRKSDHNPSGGLVLAVDITDWPGGAFDPDDWARTWASRDPRVKYLISDGQIWTRARADEGWRTYTGVNAHKAHLHVSVLADQANNVAPWAGIGRAPTPPKSIVSTTREQIVAAIYLRDDTKDSKGRDAGRIGRFSDDSVAHLTGPEWEAEQALAKGFGASITLRPVTVAQFNALASSRQDVKALNRAAALAR